MSTTHDWLRRDGMTVREVARALGISPMRVRQLEENAIRKLRRRPGLLFQFVRGCFEPVHTPRRQGASR